jgi:hypothetical protein
MVPVVLPSETPWAPAGAPAPSITNPVIRNHCADGRLTIAAITGFSPGYAARVIGALAVPLGEA